MEASETGVGVPLRVLVVEDSEDDVLLMLRTLRRNGYAPIHARVDDEPEMRRALGERPWDVIVTDHDMPRFSSNAALALVDDSGLDIPVIIVSGMIGEEQAVAAMRAGARDYVMKDNLARLPAAIERELRAAESRRAWRAAEATLRHLANHDALTDLANRQEFEARLRRVLLTSRQTGAKHALGYLDLDRFKVINDTCGHRAGDELLRAIARLLREHVRRRDTLARLGGDEFGILFEDCTVADAERSARGICEAVAAYRFDWEGASYRLGASIGLVPTSGASSSVTALLSVADSACYVAKDEGRNRVHVYRENDGVLAKRHGEMQWVGRLERAFDEDRLSLVYQPIAPIAARCDGLHFEFLLRLRGEDGSVVLPGAFLPAAERYNLASRLDRWVIDTALDWLAEHPATVQRLDTAALNLSGQSLGDPSMLEFVNHRLDAGTVAAEKLCFEITETAAIGELPSAIAFMRALRRRGCRFSLDDFGSGLSSFAYLKTMPVDYLKIDGVFVKDIVGDPIGLAMVRSINEIGHVMGKKTIAEFVENDAILARLREIGVDFAQGYGVGRPAPLDDLIRPDPS